MKLIRAPQLALVIYAGLAIVWTAPFSVHPASRVPDLGDPLHLSWVLAWDAHQIVRRPWALFESNSFYPYRHSLAFGEHMLPEALIAAPIFWLTGNAILALNLLLFVTLVLCGFFMFLLMRHLTGHAGASFLAGAAYAFNSFTRHELLRPQVLNIQWWPLALLFLYRFVREQKSRDAWLFAAAIALQGLSCSYYLLYTALLAPFWVAGAYLGARRVPSVRELRALLVALLSAAAVTSLILWPYVLNLRSMGFEKPSYAGTDLLSYVAPEPENWLWGRIHMPGHRREVPHFVGFGGAVLVFAGAIEAVRRRIAVGLIALVTTAVGVVLSLGPGITVGGVDIARGPYYLLYTSVPLVRRLGGPERIGVLVILGGAVLIGLAAASLIQRLRPRLRSVAIGALAIALPLEHWSTPVAGAAIPTGSEVPSVYRWLAMRGREPVAELPLYDERAKRLRAAYLYFSTYHWHPIPFGRTSFYPPAHDYLAWCLRDFPEEPSITLLDRLGVRTLVVHPLLWTDRHRPRHLAALDGDPRIRLLKSFDDMPEARFANLGHGQERVYEIIQRTEVDEPSCTPNRELPREGWILQSSGIRRADMVRDGNRQTSWRTDAPQAPGDFLEVTLDRVDTLSAIGLELDYPHDEFPREVKLLVRGQGTGWRPVSYADGVAEKWAFIQELLERPREARMVLSFEPQIVKAVKIAIGLEHKDASIPGWAVSELHLYGTCR